MMITRDNYESFFLDYLEGNMSEGRSGEFLNFLGQNPDLKEELHQFDNIQLLEEQVFFLGKDKMYKSINEEHAANEMKIIAFIEGDLEEEERHLFEANLADHSELQKEYDLFDKTRLVADMQIKYHSKQNLHKKSRTIVLVKWSGIAAAVFLFLLGIQALFQPEEKTNISASNKEPIPPVKEIEVAVMTKESEPGDNKINKNYHILPKETISNNDEQTDHHPENYSGVINDSTSYKRDSTIIKEINPVLILLENEPVDNLLAIVNPTQIERINSSPDNTSNNKLLTSRVKSIAENILSPQSIILTGLNIASELSGNRLNYTIKNGKISSLDCETKLVAFSIPLQKKNSITDNSE